MNFWFLMVCGIIAFGLQYILTFIQMKSFTLSYSRLRKKGRVAIGRFKGAFNAGAIVMFAIDKDGIILEGNYMQGVTVFARTKKLIGFDGMNVGLLTKEECEGKAKPITKAIIEASSNYKVIMGGGEIVEQPTPFQRIGRSITNKKIKAHN